MRAPLPVSAFALIAASPLALLALGANLGGPWPLAALLWMGFATLALDLLLPFTAGNPAPDAEFPGSDFLLAALGLAALLILPFLCLTMHQHPPSETLPLALAAGLWLGQVGHPVAHELIHRPSRPARALGVAIYTGLLIGHHASAHRLVHHALVGTALDPNTARAGQGFWHFLPRAWAGSFRAGRRAEARRGTHAYLIYALGALAALALAFVLGGAPGLVLWLAVSAHAQMQVFLSDYVQHYGLARDLRPDGKPGPVGPGHAWNAGHWASSALTLNATRHSDHHIHPAQPYPALTLPNAAPHLPWPLPVAAAVALCPPLWHRRMRPLLARLKS